MDANPHMQELQGDAQGDLDYLSSLPEGVLLRILGALDDADLPAAEGSCERLRAAVQAGRLWRMACLREAPQLARLRVEVGEVPTFGGDASGERVPLDAAESPASSSFHKKLLHALQAPAAAESLIADALLASSTDHEGESIANCLEPTRRSRNLLCYWSSAGSPDVGSSETLTFQLAHPLCRVSHIDLRPFKAWFQDDSPVYAPLSVRFRLGGLPCFDSAGRPLPKRWLVSSAAMDLLAVEAGRSGGPPGSPAAHAAEGNALWSWESPLFPVAPTDALQRFELPGAPLCVGGYLAVELIGRRQRQSADGLFYTCLSYLRAVGTPLHHFLPHSARMDRLMGWALVPYMLPDTGRRRESAPAGQAAAAFAAAAGGEEEEEEEELSAGWALAYREQDALLATGGLRAASEAGRLLHEGAEPVPPGSDDGGSDSDSDSEEGSDAGSDDSGDMDDDDVDVDGAWHLAMPHPPLPL